MRLTTKNLSATLALCFIVTLFTPILATASSISVSAFGSKSMPEIVVMVQQGSFERAKTSLKKKLALDPNYVEAHYWLAKVYTRLGSDTSALKHLARSHSLSPERQQISMEYAALLDKLKKYQAAVSIYKKILSQTEFRSERVRITRLLKLAQGRLFAHNGDFDAALDHYQMLNLQYPADALILESLAYIYAQLDFWDDAEAYYKKVIKIAPSNQNTYFLMAQMYRTNGDAKSKRENLQKVLEIDSKNANGKKALAILMGDGKKQLRSRNSVEAVEEYQVILNVLPTHLKASLAIATAFEQRKFFQEAKTTYLGLEKAYPNNIKVRSRLARLYLVFDKVDDAISQYQAILASSPETHWGTNASIKLSMLYTHKAEYLSKNLLDDTNYQQAIDVIKLWVENGQSESAQWLMEKVIRVYPKDANAKYWQGVIYEKNDQLELALAAQTQSIWIDPKSADSRLAYARLLASLGDLNEAEAAYRDVLSSNINRVDRNEVEKLIGFTAGEKLVRSNKLKLAISHYRGMQKTFVQDVGILQRIADVYVTMGDVSEANAVLDEIMKIELLSRKQKKHLNKGKQLAENGKYKEAYVELKRGLKFGSENAELFYWLGYVALQRYDYTNSNKYYKRSLEINPDSIRVRESYANSLVKASKTVLAIAQFEKLYTMLPKTDKRKTVKHQLKILKGQFLFDEERFEEALSHYHTMNIMFPRNIATLEALAKVMVKVGLLEEAKEIYNEVLRIAPNKTVSYIRLADIAEQQDEDEERLALLSQVILIDTKSVGDVAIKMLLKEAAALVESGKHEAAKTALTAILSVKPKDRNANQLMAESLVLSGKHEEAEEMYLRLLALTPSDLKTRERLAELYVNSNRMRFALAEYRKIYDIAASTEIGQSANAKLNFLYGLEAERLSKKLETQSEIDNAVSVSMRWIKDERLDAALWLLSSVVENNSQNIEAFYWLGVIHEERKELKLALSHIENGLELDSAHIRLMFIYAEINSQLGRYDIAEQQYLRLVPLLRDDDVQRKKVEKNYALLIGSRLLARGKLTAALKQLQKIQRKHPKDITVLAKIGDVLNEMKMPKEAKAIYVAALRIDPNSAIVNIALAELYKQQGDYKAYLKQLRYVFILDPNGGFTKNTARDFKLDKGIQQLHKHRWSAAVVAFNRVLETNPNNIFAQVGVSSAYLESGQLKKADASLNKVLRLENENINMRLKYLYVKTGYAFNQ